MLNTIKNYLRTNGNSVESLKKLEDILNTAVAEIEEENSAASAKIKQAREADEIAEKLVQYYTDYYATDSKRVVNISEIFTREYIDQIMGVINVTSEIADKIFDIKECEKSTTSSSPKADNFADAITKFISKI